LGNLAAQHHGIIGPFLVGHFWSLAVEEQFYLLWPLVLWNCRSLTTALRLLVALFFISLGLKIAILIGHWNVPAYYLLPTHMESISAGAFIALANLRWPDFCQRAAKIVLPATLIGLVAAFVVLHGLPDQKLLPITVVFPLAGAGSAALILRAQDVASVWSKVMNWKALRFYGKISYGFYIYHYLLREVLKKYLFIPLHGLIHNRIFAGSIYFVLALAVCTGISAASFYFYESRFLKMKRYFESRPAR